MFFNVLNTVPRAAVQNHSTLSGLAVSCFHSKVLEMLTTKIGS